MGALKDLKESGEEETEFDKVTNSLLDNISSLYMGHEEDPSIREDTSKQRAEIKKTFEKFLKLIS